MKKERKLKDRLADFFSIKKTHALIIESASHANEDMLLSIIVSDHSEQSSYEFEWVHLERVVAYEYRKAWLPLFWLSLLVLLLT